MMAGRRALAVAAVMAVLAAGGCSKHKEVASASPTSTEAPTTTSTTVGVDQIPPVITVDYAQRVMNALDKLEGDITRLLVAKRVPTIEFRQMLTTLYDGPAFDQAETSFGRDVANNLDVYIDNPGNPVTRVKRVITSSSSCAVLDVDRDLGPQLKKPQPAAASSSVVFLRPKKPDRDPLRVNATAWSITAEGQPIDGANLEQACQ